MGTKKTVIPFACVALCVLAPASVMAGDGEQPTHITDPRLLTSLGFAADARNVYTFLDRLNQPVTVASEPTDYYGGTASGFSTYSGSEFRPRVNGTTFGYCSGNEDLTLTSGEPIVEVSLDIPNGARLQAIRWWASDISQATEMVFQATQTCLPNQAPGAPNTIVLASQQTFGILGDQSGEMVINTTADTKTCRYSMRVTFGTFTLCNHILYRVRAQWVRQVTPAPATARFLDVPTNHPFFKFVEALASSGITGGCSANQFCPDSPITRGQMAVFLATALGLNWGGL